MATGDVYAAAAEGVHYVDVGLFGTPNYGSVYLVDAERPAVVDTGQGTNYRLILDALAELGVEPGDLAEVLVTHVHLDHAGGAGYLLEECPDATLRVHGDGAGHLVDPERLVAGTRAAVGDQWRFYAEPRPVPEGRVRTVADGDAVDLGDRTLDVVGAPGHAPHQVVFHDRRTGALFAGDAAGIYVPALDELRETSPPPDFDLDRCLADVDRIVERAPETVCFGHFGDRAFDADLLAGYKRTLVEWIEAVRQKRAELDDEAVVEHFVRTAGGLEEVWERDRLEGETRINLRGAFAYLDGRGE